MRILIADWMMPGTDGPAGSCAPHTARTAT
jgi:hypothetical protein